MFPTDVETPRFSFKSLKSLKQRAADKARTDLIFSVAQKTIEEFSSNDKCYYLIETTCPPVIAFKSTGVRRKTACGVPAAAQISAYCNRSSSMKVRKGSGWPSGGTPPTAKPVCWRTKSALAFSIGS